MRVFVAAIIVALLSGTAFAQEARMPQYGEEDKPKSPGQIEAEKAASEAYKKSLNNIPDRGPTDPWGAVRSNDAAKTPVATAKPKKTATGSAAARP